jgi:nicotinamidase-related amidase
MIPLEKKRTALLVMDYQLPILSRLGDAATKVLEPTKALLAKARAAKVHVVYVVIGFRPGYPEVNPRNASAAMFMKAGVFVGEPGADLHPLIRPEPGDVIVTKRRVSAFSGSDLELMLRLKGIDTLLLAGISTSGVVLSTLRQAADADYQLVVVRDGCADPDDETHRVLLDKVFVRQATVATAAEVGAALDAST